MSLQPCTCAATEPFRCALSPTASNAASGTCGAPPRPGTARGRPGSSGRSSPRPPPVPRGAPARSPPCPGAPANFQLMGDLLLLLGQAALVQARVVAAGLGGDHSTDVSSRFGPDGANRTVRRSTSADCRAAASPSRLPPTLGAAATSVSPPGWTTRCSAPSLRPTARPGCRTSRVLSWRPCTEVSRRPRAVLISPARG